MHLPFKIIYNLENYLLKSFTMFARCMDAQRQEISVSGFGARWADVIRYIFTWITIHAARG